MKDSSSTAVQNDEQQQEGNQSKSQASSAASSVTPVLPLALLKQIFEIRLYDNICAEDYDPAVYLQTQTALLSVNTELHNFVRNVILRPGRDVDFVERYEKEHNRVCGFSDDTDARPTVIIREALFDLFVKSAPDAKLFDQYRQAMQHWWPTEANLPIVLDELFDLGSYDLVTGSELEDQQALLAALPSISLLQRNLQAGGQEEQQASQALNRLVVKSVRESCRSPLGGGGSLLFKALASQVFASHLHVRNEIDVWLPETYHDMPLNKLPNEYQVFLAALEDRRREVKFTLSLMDDVESEEDASNPKISRAQQDHEQRIIAPPLRVFGLEEDITGLLAANNQVQHGTMRRHERRRAERRSAPEAVEEALALIHGYDPRELEAQGLTMADVMDPLQGRMDSDDDDWYRRMDQMVNGDDDYDDDHYGYSGDEFDDDYY